MASIAQTIAIGRKCERQEVTVATTVGNSEEVDFREAAGGMVFVPASSSITLLTYHVADYPGGTYLPANDEGGTAVTQTVVGGQAYELPKALYGAAVLKMVGDAAGTVYVTAKA